MSGETAEKESGWTPDTLRVLLDERSKHDYELRAEDHRFQEERDRRYTEVNIEREKALKIKETADLAALSLAREIQDYKDEKANNLRDQIGAERGTYATKDEIKPLSDWIKSQQGSLGTIGDYRQRSQWTWGQVVTVGGIVVVAAIELHARGVI